MRKLVFIDDDEDELSGFVEKFGSHFDLTTILWPDDRTRLFTSAKPDVVVSDLYIPDDGGDRDPRSDKTPHNTTAAEDAESVAASFSNLYKNDQPLGHPAAEIRRAKRRLQAAMKALNAGRHLLDRQWSALGQSPAFGLVLFQRVRSQWPQVPFVFYSRKITPEDVIRVLQAGAFDAIRKGALKDEEVLARLALAIRSRWSQEELKRLRDHRLNVNVTTLPRV